MLVLHAVISGSILYNLYGHLNYPWVIPEEEPKVTCEHHPKETSSESMIFCSLDFIVSVVLFL